MELKKLTLEPVGPAGKKKKKPAVSILRQGNEKEVLSSNPLAGGGVKRETDVGGGGRPGDVRDH